MARRLRIQFPGARYHIINRGNFRHNIFATTGAIHSFLATLAQAARRFAWRVHAYVVMRNHYHLALETPQPNLTEGMHWLQSTFAIRLLRFHGQHGHVFAGRYKALLIQDSFHLARVCDYIHLNPVRARIVTVERITRFKASSLWRRFHGKAPEWLVADELLRESGLHLSPRPWAEYIEYLTHIAHAGRAAAMNRGTLSRGWAIGTAGWRRALAREHRHLALAPEMNAAEIAEFKTARWSHALAQTLRACGKSQVDIEGDAKSAPWKIAAARRLRETVTPPYRWIAEQLRMGKPASVRVYLSWEINK